MKQRFDHLRNVSAAVRRNIDLARKQRRRPPKGGAPALVEPPRGPLPLRGGAAAPLEFDG